MLTNKIKKNTDWEIVDNKLHKILIFKSFMDSINFISEIALYIDKTDHHPEWKNIYNKLEIKLITHNKNEITDKDIKLANKIDELFKSKYKNKEQIN